MCLLSLSLVSETCQTFKSVWVSNECHWLAYIGSHLAGNHRLTGQRYTLAKDLAIFCDSLSALVPFCGLKFVELPYSPPFHDSP